MSKHTPGPWTWEKDKYRGGYSGLYAGNNPVLCPQHENDGDDGAAWFGTDEDYYGETTLTEANARLIEAAPAMYDMLTACAAQFMLYAKHHEEKGDAEKAAVNAAYVKRITELLDKVEGQTDD